MKYSIVITPNNYPIRFQVLLGYGDKNKGEIVDAIKGVSAYVKKHMIKEILETDLSEAHGWCFTCSTYIAIILPVWKNEPEYYGALQHEILHGVIYSGKKCGFKISEDSEEYYTYMLQFVTNKIYKTLWTTK